MAIAAAITAASNAVVKAIISQRRESVCWAP
jgi:hypothetical protein